MVDGDVRGRLPLFLGGVQEEFIYLQRVVIYWYFKSPGGRTIKRQMYIADLRHTGQYAWLYCAISRLSQKEKIPAFLNRKLSSMH